ERFRSALVAAAEAVTVGDPFTDGTDIGPVINAKALDRITAWVDEAVNKGARILNTTAEVPTSGTWYPPTVIEGVPADSELGRGEIFGPLTQLLRTSSRDEAVAAINDEPYGLASTVWCEDLGTVKWWSDRIRVGTLAVNGYSEGTVATPFGGLRQSGFWGRDNGPEALETYQETMTVGIAPQPAGSGRSVSVAERWGGANRGGPGGGNRFCQGRVEGPTLRRCRHGSRRGRCEVLPRPRPGRHPGPCGQGARRRPHHGEPTGPTPRSRPGSAAVHPHPQRLDHQPQRREAAAGRPDGCPRQRRLHHRGLCADGSGGVDDPQPRRLRRQRADPGVRPPARRRHRHHDH